MNKSEKINYIVENKMVSAVDLTGKEIPFNESDIRISLDVLEEKDLDPIISAWEKSEALGAGGSMLGNTHSREGLSAKYAIVERGVLNHGEGWEG